MRAAAIQAIERTRSGASSRRCHRHGKRVGIVSLFGSFPDLGSAGRRQFKRRIRFVVSDQSIQSLICGLCSLDPTRSLHPRIYRRCPTTSAHPAKSCRPFVMFEVPEIVGIGAGFSDVGMRVGAAGSGRRPKSAQARNRGQNGRRWRGWLYGDLRLAAALSATFDVDRIHCIWISTPSQSANRWSLRTF